MTYFEYLRRVEGLTQAQLAKRLLYSKATVCLLENRSPDSTEVSPRVRATVERYFNVPLEELLKQVELPAMGRKAG